MMVGPMKRAAVIDDDVIDDDERTWFAAHAGEE